MITRSNGNYEASTWPKSEQSIADPFASLGQDTYLVKVFDRGFGVIQKRGESFEYIFNANRGLNSENLLLKARGDEVLTASWDGQIHVWSPIY